MAESDAPNPAPILADRALVNGIETELTFTEDGKLRWNAGGQKCLTVEKEVLGFCAQGRKLRLRCVLMKGNGICCVRGDMGGRVREDFLFELLAEDSQRLWCEKLREYIDSLGRPKRLFIFVNPYGGKRSASKIFMDVVKPLLEDADVQITVQETKHQLHAKKVVSTMDLSKYEGIICVSGDGILVEVVNGLLEREDWSSAIKMPLGVVPAGTGNGMIKSLLDSVGEPCTAFNSVLAIIRGHKRPLDLATILQGKTKFFSVLMLAWGLVADIDIESEKYRWMGSARIDFYALQRIFHLRQYNGRVCFVPAPGFESYGEPANYDGGSSSTQKISDAIDEETFDVQQHGYQGPEIKLEDLDWRAINGPFVSIWLHNVPWGGENTLAAPDAKFSDGYLDLIIIRDCPPKLSLLSLMSDMSNGGHVRSPFVSYLKVKAFVLEPGGRTDDPSKEGIIDSDGEVLARGKGTYKYGQKTMMTYDKLEITVDQGLCTIFSPL